VPSSFRCSVISPSTFSPTEVIFLQETAKDVEKFSMIFYRKPCKNINFFMNGSTRSCTLKIVSLQQETYKFKPPREYLPHKVQSAATQKTAWHFHLHAKKKNISAFYLSCERYLTFVWADLIFSRNDTKLFIWIRKSCLEETDCLWVFQHWLGFRRPFRVTELFELPSHSYSYVG
jgi:hypothetical protein